MKKQKRNIAALVLTFIIVFTLAACGGNNTPTDSSPPSPPPTETPSPSPSPNDDDKQPDVSDPPVVNIGSPFPFAFTAQDIYGNTVTEADLSGKEIWFVHYWGTWCIPCIDELPDLGQLASHYEASVGFLALLDDFEKQEYAQGLYDMNAIPANFISVDVKTTFDAEHPIMKGLNIQDAPTTIIIDADGNILEHIPLAKGSGYGELLDNHLADPLGPISPMLPPKLSFDKTSFAVGEDIIASAKGVSMEMVYRGGARIGFYEADKTFSEWFENARWFTFGQQVTGQHSMSPGFTLPEGHYECRLYGGFPEDGIEYESVMITVGNPPLPPFVPDVPQHTRANDDPLRADFHGEGYIEGEGRRFSGKLGAVAIYFEKDKVPSIDPDDFTDFTFYQGGTLMTHWITFGVFDENAVAWIWLTFDEPGTYVGTYKYRDVMFIINEASVVE